MPAATPSAEFNPGITPVRVQPITNARSGPESVVSEGVEELDNSELRKVANDVLGQFKYALTVAAADLEADTAPGSVEAGFQDSLRRMSAERQAKMGSVASSLLTADVAVRQRLFGRIADTSPEVLRSEGLAKIGAELPGVPIDAKLVGLPSRSLRVPLDAIRIGPNGPQVDLEGFGDFEDVESLTKAIRGDVEEAMRTRVNSAKLQDIWGRGFFPDEAVEPPGGEFEDFEAAIPDKISVDVRRFRCVDETNPEFWGSDEYALGGTGIDESGDVHKISERYIGGGFDDGDQKWLGWNGWTTFSLRERGGLKKGWPKTYRAVLILAEKDHGGLESFLSDLYEKVRDQVKTAIEKAVAAGLSVYVGEAIATVLGKAVAWVVDKLIGWLINLFGDDIFPGFTTSLRHVHYNGRFTVNGQWGSLVSPTYQAHFYGHGGHGLVEYRWRLHS